MLAIVCSFLCAGSGLAGFALACGCRSRLMTVTDLGGEPIDNLRLCADICTHFLPPHAPHLLIAFVPHVLTDKDTHGVCGNAVSVAELDWFTPAESCVDAATVDVIVGADLVYDVTTHAALVGTLAYFRDSRPSASSPLCAYLACSIRTESTFSEFTRLLKEHGFMFTVVYAREMGCKDDDRDAAALHYILEDDVGIRASSVAAITILVLKIDIQ